MRTAVVILNWNTKDFLERFLPGLVKSMPEGAEVVVADNGSDDGYWTRTMASREAITERSRR